MSHGSFQKAEKCMNVSIHMLRSWQDALDAIKALERKLKDEGAR